MDGCEHINVIPIEIVDRAWIHWCPTCGAISSESNYVDQPREPWVLPGELSNDDVARIVRAATE